MEVVGIKFRNNCKMYYFSPNGLKLKSGDKVVIDTPNGHTLATISTGNFDIDDEKIVAALSNVVRLATDKDISSMEKLESKRDEVIETTKSLIKKYNLDMKLVDCEFTLDGQKIIITYICEDRVDFRELVKDLASKLKSRIELKQIGIRDQAKSIGGLGYCGEVCCCNRYLNNFDKVSIKMAKTQDLSLNPTKISGVCGRLMCCLGYENEVYSEAAKYMPRVNSKVNTPDGFGTVVYNNMLKKICDVKLDGDNALIKKYSVKDLKFDGKIDFDDSLSDENFVLNDLNTQTEFDFMPKNKVSENLENKIEDKIVETHFDKNNHHKVNINSNNNFNNHNNNNNNHYNKQESTHNKKTNNNINDIISNANVKDNNHQHNNRDKGGFNKKKFNKFNNKKNDKK